MHRAQGAGIQLHVRVGCTGVWIWWALPPIVSFIASPPTGMMKSQAAVVWRGQTRQLNSPGKRQNGCRPHSSTTILCCVWWETAVLQHEGEGPIKGHQIFICHKAPSPLALSPQSRATNHQERLLLKTTRQSRACRNRRNSVNYFWPHTRQHWVIYWWAQAEARAIYSPLNTPTTRITDH